MISSSMCRDWPCQFLRRRTLRTQSPVPPGAFVYNPRMGITLLLPLILIPGAAVQLSFGSARSRSGFAWRVAVAGFLLVAAGGLLLAEISRFSPAALCVLMTVVSIAILLPRRVAAGALLRTLSARRALPSVVPLRAAVALAAIVLASAVLFARPGEFFAGGWDPGVYLAAGSSIAHRGGLIAKDPLLASLDAGERAALYPVVGRQHLKYPGFYIHDAAVGTVVPQFQPLYPVLLALVISLAGERAALYLNPALALAGVLLLYRLVCPARGRTHGLVAASLLALNVVQVWNARFPTSEVLAQALLLTGFVFLAEFLEDGDRAAGALSGLAFGLATAATVTTVIVAPFALAAAFRPGDGRSSRPFVAALALTLTLTGFWSALIAPEYLASVSGFFPGLRHNLSIAVPLVAALAWLGWASRGRLAAACAARAARPALAAAFLLALLWFGAGRPLLEPGEPALALAKLSRYLTPGVLLLFAAGGAGMLARGGRRVETALLLGGAAMLFFFLHAPLMYPTYPFTLRRFTPLAIPAIAYAAALVPAALLSARRSAVRAAGGALLAAALVLQLLANRDLLRLREYAGLGDFLSGLEADLPAGGILLCEGRLPAYFLEHAASRRVLILDRDAPGRAAAVESFAARRLAAGERVTLLTPAERPWSEQLRFEPIFTRRLRTSRLSQELTRFPSPVQLLDLEYTAYRVELHGDGASGERFPARVDLGLNALGLGKGFPLAVQYGGERAWARWTGAAAELPVPWPVGGGVEIVLRAASGQRRPTLARVRVLLDGELLGENVAVPAAMTELIFPALPPPGAPRPRRLLRIESSTWNPRAQGLPGYPDGLGILVDWVEIRPLPVADDAARAACK